MTRSGRPISLTPKAFDLLVYLVEHHGRLVEKPTLMSALWPDSIVEEANLAFQISALRKALGDGGNGEAVIQTVPTRGYRFVGAVSTIANATPSADRSSSATARPVADARASASAGADARPVKRGRAVTVAPAAVLLFAAIVGGLVWSRRQTVSPNRAVTSREPTLTRITANSSEQSVTSARISPDGRMLAYTDPAGIHVQFIDTGETELIAETRGMGIYAWTSDSTKVRAASCNERTCVGWDISVVGGTRYASGARWPANIAMIAAFDGSRLATLTDYRRVSVDPLNGTPPRVVLQSPVLIQLMNWSRDGSRIFFVANECFKGWYRPCALNAVSINGGPPLTLLKAEPGQAIAEVLEIANDRLVLVMTRKASGDRARGATEVSLQELSIKETGIVTGPPRILLGWRQDHIDQLSASADGTRIAMLTGTTHDRTYVAGFDAASGRIDEPRRLTNDDWDTGATAWTSDGAAVLFTSNRNDDSDIFSQRLDSAVQVPRVIGPGSQFRPEATSDGRWLLYVDLKPESWRLMRIPLAGGSPEPLVTVAEWGMPRCSLHGRCVVEEGQGAQLVVSDLDPLRGKGRELGRWPFSPFGFCVTSDGNEAAFILPEQDAIRIVSLETGRSRDIRVNGAQGLKNLDPVPGNGGFLTSISATGRSRALALIRPDGTWRVLWAPTDLVPQSAISSRDGRRLAIDVEAPHSNAWMLSGF